MGEWNPTEVARDLDRRRTLVLAKLLPMLSLMAGGEAAEVIGYDAADLYTEALVALGIEDEDNPDTMAAVIVEMDGNSGHGIMDRLDQISADEGARELAYFNATNCLCTAAGRFMLGCPKHGAPTQSGQE